MTGMHGIRRVVGGARILDERGAGSGIWAVRVPLEPDPDASWRGTFNALGKEVHQAGASVLIQFEPTASVLAFTVEEDALEDTIRFVDTLVARTNEQCKAADEREHQRRVEAQAADDAREQRRAAVEKRARRV